MWEPCDDRGTVKDHEHHQEGNARTCHAHKRDTGRRQDENHKGLDRLA